ncbi:MAG: hypothetical protein HY534_05025 [Chloroflexi bacterium]|nr:hypothetical protein [Chloroflexota bacterium]
MAWDLVGFLKAPMSPSQCIALVKGQLVRREGNLLHVIESLVFHNPRSPYLPLLRYAGCELGDVRAMVQKEGVEGALRRLQEAGVYLTYEEFKGRTEIVRGSRRFHFRERDFDNPAVRAHFRTSSSGSTGQSVTAPLDFRYIVHDSTRTALGYLSLGVQTAVTGHWRPAPPDPLGVQRVLHGVKATGRAPERWFSLTKLQDPVGIGAMAGLVSLGRVFGYRFPWPQYVPLDQAEVVARWLAEAAAGSGTVVLSCFTSPALAVAHAARRLGLDLHGALFAIGGEPVTPARLEELTSTGARVTQVFAASEIGRQAVSCANPTYADDLHLMTDGVAVTRYSRDHRGVAVEPLLFTGLHALTPKVLINVETDDTAVLEQRSCGCLLDEIGLTTHMHHIRSFGKITTQGMTVLGGDLARIVDELLPARFGGSPIDYQFVEREAPDGTISVTLRISPEAGAIDEAAVIEGVLAELRKGRPAYQLAAEVWRQAEALRVERERPVATLRGKVLPLYLSPEATGVSPHDKRL